MAKYLNLDDITIDKRFITIGGKEFDVSEMPVNVMLFLNARTVERRMNGSEVLYSDYHEAFVQWIKSIDESITTDWFNSHINGSKLKTIVNQVFVPLLVPSPVEFTEPEAPVKQTPKKE